MTKTTSPDSLAYSVAGFCKAVGISPRTFWTLQKAGNGPPLVRIGRRVLVRKEAAETWLNAREGITMEPTFLVPVVAKCSKEKSR